MDAVRLYGEFQDDLGTAWRVNIHDANFVGTAAEFKLGADGFVLRYSGNNEDRYQPIIGSEVTFTLTETESAHESFMDLLATQAEQRFSVSIRKDPDGANTFYWGGVLYPEQVIRPYDARPIQNTLTAADDIGNLQAVKYNNNGTAYTGEQSVVDHILNCLNKTRATHLWGIDDFLYYINDFKSTDYIDANQLKDTRIKHTEFYNVDENGENQYFDSYKILNDIARAFNARIFQAQGKWWFVPLGAQKYSTTLTIEGTQKDGTPITQISQAAAKAFDASFERLRGYEYTYLAPAKTVSRTRRYDGNLPVIYDALHTEAEFGTTLSDTDIDYPLDTVLAVSGEFGYFREGDNSAPGVGNIGRVMLRFTIKCGQYYLKRTATFDDTVLTYFIDPGGALQYYTGHVYGPVSWETTQEYYTIVSLPFDEATTYSGGFDFYIDAPPLPTDETGLDMSVSITGVDHNGSNESALISSADYDIVDFRADIISPNGQGDEVVFTAVNSDAARFDIEQGECIIGDAETINSIGVIRVLQSGVYEPSTSWQSLNYTGAGVGISRLGVQEALGGQNKATPVQRGDVFGSEIYMWQVIDDNTTNFAGDYALFELTYTARSVMNQIEAFRVLRDVTNVTTGVSTPRNRNNVIGSTPIAIAARTFTEIGDYIGIGARNYGSRNQTVIRTITNRAGSSENVADIDLHIFNTWTGGNGVGLVYLPPIAESHGRIIQFHSDATITANTYVQLRPNSADTGVTIDGSNSYDFNRNYDGITILGHTDGNWYIIQKKDK